MQNIFFTFPEPKSEAEYQEAVKQICAEMQRINQQMDNDRKEIDHLKVETRALLAGLGVVV